MLGIEGDGFVQDFQGFGRFAFVDVEGAEIVLDVGVGRNIGLGFEEEIAGFRDVVFVFVAGAEGVEDLGVFDGVEGVDGGVVGKFGNDAELLEGRDDVGTVVEGVLEEKGSKAVFSGGGIVHAEGGAEDRVSEVGVEEFEVDGFGFLVAVGFVEFGSVEEGVFDRGGGGGWDAEDFGFLGVVEEEFDGGLVRGGRGRLIGHGGETVGVVDDPLKLVDGMMESKVSGR